MQRSRGGRSGQTLNGAAPKEGRAKQRALSIGVSQDGAPLDELAELLRTAGVAVVGEEVQRRDAPHPDTYLGQGKIAEVRALAKQFDANVIACDDELSPRQER